MIPKGTLEYKWSEFSNELTMHIVEIKMKTGLCLSGRKLPGLEEIPGLQYYRESPFVLPPFREMVLKSKIGAPVKRKNSLAARYKLKNTQGTRFKFSFILQILMAHLHHLFGLKGKSRYQRGRWLRLHKKDGAALVKQIKATVGENGKMLELKRTVSVTTLKEWLKGDSFIDSNFDTSQISDLRCDVFRKFCILKLIDIENQFSSDFNVISQKDYAWKPFKEYIMQTLWEEIEYPPISHEEVVHILRAARCSS